MKGAYLLIITLHFVCQIGLAQNENIFTIDSIPKEGVLLDHGWKYIVDDNPKYAQNEFDDTHWQSIEPALDILELKQIKPEGTIWLRLQFDVFKIDSKQLILAVEQSGASQIFLNGKLLVEYGTFSNNKNQIKAFNPLNKPIIILPDTFPVQTLAVRYAFQPKISYKPIYGIAYPLFKVTINLPYQETEQSTRNKIQMFAFGVRIGAFLIFFIINFLFYLFYPKSKSNLFLALFALSGVFAGVFSLLSNNANLLFERNIFSFLDLISTSIANILLIYAVYLLVKQKPKKLFIAIILLELIVISTLLFDNNIGWFIGITAQFSEALFVVYITSKAYKQKIPGSIYLVIGTILYILFYLIFLVFLALSINQIAPFVFYHLYVFSIPISVLAVLGVQIRNTNKSLTKKLEEVKTLSEEKQQILVAQNETLEQQVNERTFELSKSLQDLKSTQSQLIQSEKMASLGELTAGIAHEIQNPLNFVNNFSEVNAELIEELKAERVKLKGDRDEKLEEEILNDLEENEEKIKHHGRRASGIVKGMLEHSRTSDGQKEPTDLNALADEYLRLSYHGLRAKDKSFNADFKTDFDETLPKINVIPQDIGRVLLNLINNAFYSVDKKAARHCDPERSEESENYQPKVVVSTRQVDGKIEISVRDNGEGIPEQVRDKIFQPFFTTKPTGSGTGLGLSLSYDIVKAHGGELKVETVQGIGSEFIIQLATL